MLVLDGTQGTVIAVIVQMLLASSGQVSEPLQMPSKSLSRLAAAASHMSPTPLPLQSRWSTFGTVAQLSTAQHTPSKSPSAPAAPLVLQASPSPSPLQSAWSGLNAAGQLSMPSSTPSESESAAHA